MFIFISVSFNTRYTSILKYVSLYVYIACFIQQLQVSDLLYHADLPYITSEILLCEEESQWKALKLVLISL